jgi:threonine dehydratase
MTITIDDILRARETLAGIVVRTPLLELYSSVGDQIWVKPEVLQPIGSYKLRGTYNAVSGRLRRGEVTGVSTLSAGNTSQGVAWAARRLGLRAKAVMPETAPRFKIDATRAYGAEIEFLPVEEMWTAFRDGRYEHNPGFIHPIKDEDMFAGHGTIGLEILEDMPDVDTVIVPVGGGGLLIGIATAIKHQRPDARVLGVQPEGLSALAASLAAGEPRTTTGTSFVDGAGSPFVMENVFPDLQRLSDGCVTVTDDETRAAMLALLMKNKLVTEGAGALSVAAALNTPLAERGKTICILSGGSVDPSLLAEILTGRS